MRHIMTHTRHTIIQISVVANRLRNELNNSQVQSFSIHLLEMWNWIRMKFHIYLIRNSTSFQRHAIDFRKSSWIKCANWHTSKPIQLFKMYTIRIMHGSRFILHNDCNTWNANVDFKTRRESEALPFRMLLKLLF